MPDASSLMTMQQIRHLYNLQKANVTDNYDSTATYEIGDYCLYLGVLYRCISTISTAEDFDSSHWVSTNVDAELDRIEAAAVAKTDIVNNLTSTSTDAPLSANMGKALNDAITQSTADVIRTGDVVNNLTSTATDKPGSANMLRKLNSRIVTNELLFNTSTDVVSSSSVHLTCSEKLTNFKLIIINFSTNSSNSSGSRGQLIFPMVGQGDGRHFALQCGLTLGYIRLQVPSDSQYDLAVISTGVFSHLYVTQIYGLFRISDE